MTSSNMLYFTSDMDLVASLSDDEIVAEWDDTYAEDAALQHSPAPDSPTSDAAALISAASDFDLIEAGFGSGLKQDHAVSLTATQASELETIKRRVPELLNAPDAVLGPSESAETKQVSRKEVHKANRRRSSTGILAGKMEEVQVEEAVGNWSPLAKVLPTDTEWTTAEMEDWVPFMESHYSSLLRRDGAPLQKVLRCKKKEQATASSICGSSPIISMMRGREFKCFLILLALLYLYALGSTLYLFLSGGDRESRDFRFTSPAMNAIENFGLLVGSCPSQQLGFTSSVSHDALQVSYPFALHFAVTGWFVVASGTEDPPQPGEYRVEKRKDGAWRWSSVGTRVWRAAMDQMTAFAQLGQNPKLPAGKGERLEVQLMPPWPWWLGQFGVNGTHGIGLLIVAGFAHLGRPNRGKAALAMMFMTSSAFSFAVVVALSVRGAEHFRESFVWWRYGLSSLLLMGVTSVNSLEQFTIPSLPIGCAVYLTAVVLDHIFVLGSAWPLLRSKEVIVSVVLLVCGAALTIERKRKLQQTHRSLEDQRRAFWAAWAVVIERTSKEEMKELWQTIEQIKQRIPDSRPRQMVDQAMLMHNSSRFSRRESNQRQFESDVITSLQSGGVGEHADAGPGAGASAEAAAAAARGRRLSVIPWKGSFLVKGETPEGAPKSLSKAFRASVKDLSRRSQERSRENSQTRSNGSDQSQTKSITTPPARASSRPPPSVPWRTRSFREAQNLGGPVGKEGAGRRGKGEGGGGGSPIAAARPPQQQLDSMQSTTAKKARRRSILPFPMPMLGQERTSGELGSPVSAMWSGVAALRAPSGGFPQRQRRSSNEPELHVSWVPVRNLDQLYSQAQACKRLLKQKILSLARDCKVNLHLPVTTQKPDRDCKNDQQFLPWSDINDDPEVLSAIKWAKLKDPNRAVHKVLRFYHNDVSMLLDVCRETLVFESMSDMAKCLREIAGDDEIIIQRLDDCMGTEPKATAFRHLRVNLRMIGHVAKGLSVHGHSCELIFIFRETAESMSIAAHEQYLRYRELREADRLDRTTLMLLQAALKAPHKLLLSLRARLSVLRARLCGDRLDAGAEAAKPDDGTPGGAVPQKKLGEAITWSWRKDSAEHGENGASSLHSSHSVNGTRASVDGEGPAPTKAAVERSKLWPQIKPKVEEPVTTYSERRATRAPDPVVMPNPDPVVLARTHLLARHGSSGPVHAPAFVSVGSFRRNAFGIGVEPTPARGTKRSLHSSIRGSKSSMRTGGSRATLSTTPERSPLHSARSSIAGDEESAEVGRRLSGSHEVERVGTAIISRFGRLPSACRGDSSPPSRRRGSKRASVSSEEGGGARASAGTMSEKGSERSLGEISVQNGEEQGEEGEMTEEEHLEDLTLRFQFFRAQYRQETRHAAGMLDDRLGDAGLAFGQAKGLSVLDTSRPVHAALCKQWFRRMLLVLCALAGGKLAYQVLRINQIGSAAARHVRFSIGRFEGQLLSSPWGDDRGAVLRIALLRGAGCPLMMSANGTWQADRGVMEYRAELEDATDFTGFYFVKGQQLAAAGPTAFRLEASQDGVKWDTVGASGRYLQTSTLAQRWYLKKEVWMDELGVVQVHLQPTWDFLFSTIGVDAVVVVTLLGMWRSGYTGSRFGAHVFTLGVLAVGAVESVHALASLVRGESLLAVFPWLRVATSLLAGTVMWFKQRHQISVFLLSQLALLVESVAESALMLRQPPAVPWWPVALGGVALVLFAGRLVLIRQSRAMMEADESKYEEVWQGVYQTERQWLARLEGLAAQMRSTTAEGYVLQRYTHKKTEQNKRKKTQAGGWWGSSSGRAVVGGADGAADSTQEVESLDQMYAAAVGMHGLLLDRVREWALGSHGCFMLKPLQAGKRKVELVRWEDALLDEQVAARVKWGELKKDQRAIEKVMRSYKGRVARLVDICRQSIVFSTTEDLCRCLEMIAEDDDIKVCSIKNRLTPAYDAHATAGYRDVNLNICIVNDDTHRLGLANHVCEVQLLLDKFAMLKNDAGHKRYVAFRNARGL